MKALFQNLGLDEKETRAFLKILELGAQPISIAAKYVGVPRSSMYAILERLKRLQLIEEFERNGITYVKCVPVSSIEDILLAKETRIQQTFKIYQKALPQLEALENKLSITPKVKFFEGKEAAMKMYEEVLKEKEFYALFNPELVKHAMPEYVYKVAETVKKNRTKAKELVTDCAIAHEYKKRFDSPLHQIKFLPKETQIPSDIIICKNKIYIITYSEKETSALEVLNPALAAAQKMLFEVIWERF